MRVGRLVVASHNPDKVAEIETVLAGSGIDLVEGQSWPAVEETGTTLEENALLKAKAVYQATGFAALADDTGLFVEVLGGLPGVHTARFAGPDATYADNVRLLVKKLEGVDARKAVFRTVVALVSDDGNAIAEGELAGSIAPRPRGNNGFGYDPVFLLDSGKTLAELGDEEKNRLSHRARAVRALLEKLEA